MKILDILTAPWAIQPEKLEEIQEIYATHLRGEKIDIAAVERRLGRPLSNEQRRYDVFDGVAVIGLEGVIAKRMNLFSEISGGASTQLVERDLRDAARDSSVHSVILSIDSPGGTVDGTQQLANTVRQVNEEKPVVTLADGVMASAAYWIGSAGRGVYIADDTTQVGSIGVVAKHMDVSAAEAQRGVKTTEIYAGKYKRIASSYAPLSDEGRATMQAHVDYLYSLFVKAVATHRGVSEEKVLQDMAEGRVFIGQQAIAAGLVDGVSTLDALVASLNRDRAGAARPSPTTKGSIMSLTREQIEAQAPDLVAAFRAEGAHAERERIKAVEEQLIPGHEAIVATMKFDGKSTAADAAMAITAAEKRMRSKAADELSAEAPAPLPTGATPALDLAEQQRQKAAADLEALPLEDRCKRRWESEATLRQEFTSLAAYTAFERANSEGRARIKKG